VIAAVGTQNFHAVFHILTIFLKLLTKGHFGDTLDVVHFQQKGSPVASRVVTLLTDDLDGSEAEETISFSFEGFSYEIDLSKAHVQGLRDALEPYVKAGRRTGRDGRRVRRSGSAAATDGDQTKAIRDWAKSQKLKVSDRGRVSAEIREAYSKAH
jgi:hypothetical protein